MICIDQRNEDEKSQQVAMMGEIYQRAEKVCAWIGEGDPRVACILDILTEYRDRKILEQLPAHLDAAEQLSYQRVLFRAIYLDRAGILPSQSDLDDTGLLEEFNWLRPLYTQPYWRRVWIVQELVLASVVIVCYEDKSIDFDEIYGLSLDWGSFDQGFDTGCYLTSKPQSRGWITIQAIRGHRQRRQKSSEVNVAAPHPIKVIMSERSDVAMLDEVIEIYARHHECYCLKDKVYGFRELRIQWRESLIVDYTQSTKRVFLDVAKLDLLDQRKHGGIDVAFHLWEAMELGDRAEFNSCMQQHFQRLSVE